MEDTKRSKKYLLEQQELIIMNTFKGQDNDTLKKLCAENNCDVVIVPHSLNFQQLDLSVNKAAKAFIQNKYNDWFADQVFTQLKNGKDHADVKIWSKLLELKSIYATWIFEWYNHVIKEKEMIVRGFSSAGILGDVQNDQVI